MRKILLTMIIAAGFSTAVLAQASATATASATIVTPIAITKTVEMEFGNVAVNGSGGTVILAPNSDRTPTGGVVLPATTGTFTAAEFDVTGSEAYTYDITLPSSEVTLTITDGGSETMILDEFTSVPSGTGVLTSGAQTILVGATLNVSAGQAAGTYTNANAVPVTVVYN